MIAQETFDKHWTPARGFDLPSLYQEYYGVNLENPEAYAYLSLPEVLYPIRSRQVAVSMIAWARVLETRPQP
jgi:hypothetical protein